MISSRIDASGIASRHSHPPGAGFSTSSTCDRPPCSLALILTVCVQRRPTRRSLRVIPGILEGELRGIEIDASERACLPTAADELQFLRARAKPSHHRFVDDELQLDL